MKALLEFSLPEDADDHRDALDGPKWKLVCWNLDDELRRIIKYGENPKISLCAQSWRDKLHELIQERNLNLWE